MKPKLLFVLILVSVVLGAQSSFAEYPKPVGYLNDFAHLLSQDQHDSLLAELIAFEQKTEIEIAVVTVNSLDGKNVESYTRRLATRWGVGKEGKDNGLVFLIAPNERKMRIQGARGLKVFTSSDARRIRDKSVLPKFKKEDMSGGLIDGTHAIMQTIEAGIRRQQEAERYAAEHPPQPWTQEDTRNLLIALGVFAFAVMLIVAISLHIRRRSARTYVLGTKSNFANRLADAKRDMNMPGVSDKYRDQLKRHDAEFQEISQLHEYSTGIKWVRMKDKLQRLNSDIYWVEQNIRSAKKRAQKAREEVPVLMEKLPDMLAEIEQKLSEGKDSERARGLLKQAHTEFSRARSLHVQHNTGGGIDLVDLLIIYAILESVSSDCSSAVSTHHELNNPSSSRSSYSSNRNSGYGNNDGFGGGGGFDFGGGGASGSW